MTKRKRKYVDYNKLLNRESILKENRKRRYNANKAHKIPRYYVDSLEDKQVKQIYKYVKPLLRKTLSNENYTQHLIDKINSGKVYMKPELIKDILKGEYSIIEVAKFEKDGQPEYRFLIKSNSVYEIFKQYTHFYRYEYSNLYLVVSDQGVIVTAYNSNENKKREIKKERYKNVTKNFNKTIDRTTKVL